MDEKLVFIFIAENIKNLKIFLKIKKLQNNITILSF
jgi:hypothetical protein